MWGDSEYQLLQSWRLMYQGNANLKQKRGLQINHSFSNSLLEKIEEDQYEVYLSAQYHFVTQFPVLLIRIGPICP